MGRDVPYNYKLSTSFPVPYCATLILRDSTVAVNVTLGLFKKMSLIDSLIELFVACIYCLRQARL